MAEKRVTQQVASDEIYSDDWFLKDSVLHDTTKVQPSVMKTYFNQGMATSQDVTDEATARTNADNQLASGIGKQMSNLADFYSTTTSYVVGDVCILQSGELMRCIGNTSGSFDNTKWEQITVDELIADEATTRASADTTLTNKSNQILADIADEYDSAESYDTGDVTIHENKLYRAIEDDITGTWDASKWEQVTVDELIDDLNFSAEAISYDNTSSGLEADNAQDAIDETITKLSAVGTASGDIATFDDGSDLSMPKLEVAIEPQQDLHGYDAPWVGGTGKNKFNPVNYESHKQADGSYRLTGINSNAISNAVPSNVVGQEVTFSAYFDLTKEASPTYIRILVSVGGSYSYSDIQANTKGTRSVTFTPQSTSDSIKIIYGSDGSNYFTMSQLQLEIGNQVTSYLPYSNICPISGWDECNVGVVGKNILKLKSGGSYTPSYRTVSVVNNEISYVLSTDLGISQVINSDGVSALFDTKKLKAGTYTFSLLTNLSTSASTFKLTFTDGTQVGNGDSFTLSEEKTIDSIIASTAIIVSAGAYYIKIQIESGNQATTYEPYNGATYTIDLDGTRYGGKVDLVSGVMTVDRVSVNMGDLNWTKQNTTSGNWRFISSQSIQNIKLPTDASWKIDNLCSVYQNVTANETWTAEKTGIAINADGKLLICDLNQADTTALGVVIANQTYCYELATPLTIQLTPTLVKSLRGVNNVYADCGEILDAEYIRDLTTIINYILEQLGN